MYFRVAPSKPFINAVEMLHFEGVEINDVEKTSSEFSENLHKVEARFPK